MSNRNKIYVVVLIWAAALLQIFINSSIVREEKMVEEAMSSNLDNIMEGSVTAYGYFGTRSMTPGSREVIVKRLAERLGITGGYDIENRSSDANQVTCLKKNGEYADTTIKVITLLEKDDYNQEVTENYIMVEISLKGPKGREAYNFMEKIEGMYGELGMDADTGLYILSQRPGEMTQGEIQSEMDKFMETTDATLVDSVEFDNVYSFYGYSNEIDRFAYQGDKKVNVNIAFSYDAKQDVTYIHRGIPFIDKSF